MTSGQRIKKVREKLGLDQVQFSAALDLKQGSFSSIENDKVGISSKVRRKLLEIFRINPSWLDAGSGEMFLDLDYAEEMAFFIKGGGVLDQKSFHDSSKPSLHVVKDKDGTTLRTVKRIPYYNIDFTAGTAAVFSDTPETPDYYIDISPLNDCDKALPIFGDSMYPIYQNGDIILCKEIIDKSVIPLGEAFLIVTKEHRMLKYLKKGPKAGVLLAVSENKEHYDPFEIPVDKILKLFIVKGVIKRKVI